MSLPLHESRVLALIEMSLCREDRELAARFAMFNRLSAGETPPRREHMEQPSRRLCWLMTVLLIVSILVLGAVAAAVTG